jgi:hypothetical protein
MSILFATSTHGILSLYSRSSLSHVAKCLYVIFLVMSNTYTSTNALATIGVACVCEWGGKRLST